MRDIKHSPHLASPKGRGITSRAFTLVELIVVVTILAILATIGFVSYSSYLTGVRDTNRLAQLVSIHDGLELYRTSKDLPLPDESVDVIIGTETIATQGYAGSNVLETIDFTKGGVDPRDGEYFSYYLTDDRKYFQLMAFLEEETNITTQVIPSPGRGGLGRGFLNQAKAVDYSSRVPTIYGKKLGILTNSENTPIQEIQTIKDAGFIDFDGTGDNYIAHLDDEVTIESNSTEILQGIFSYISGKNQKDCKSILANAPLAQGIDGEYWITTGGESLKVYCDMTTDGGGWTFFGFADAADGGDDFFGEGDGQYLYTREDRGVKYSLGSDDFEDTEMMVLLDNKDPIEADTENKIVFYKYDVNNALFNTGPLPCAGIGTGFSYKTQIGGSYVTGGALQGCSTLTWFPRTPSTSPIGYLALFRKDSEAFDGNYWGVGMGGNNSRNHDGYWYLR